MATSAAKTPGTIAVISISPAPARASGTKVAAVAVPTTAPAGPSNSPATAAASIVAAAPSPVATPAPATSTPAGATATPAAPTAPAQAPCTGIQIAPGLTADRIQQLVDGNPSGTVFCFASGTYVLNHYVTLKDSNQFICPVRRTCVLTGLDQYRGALAAEYGTTRQVIRGFVVEHFIEVPGAWPNAGLQVRDYGLLEDNETRFNQTGLHVGSNQTIRGNDVHHNRQYGIEGGPADNVLIENNEVAWNNTAHYDPNNDAGGSKIVGSEAGTHFLTWRRNYVHDNYGQGIWSDGNVRNATYEENVIENNGGAGIDHEISWDAVIRNNTLRNNNTFEQGQGKSCWHGSQIAVNNSQNVAIYGNTIEAIGSNAICIVNTTRSERAVFPQSLANVSVTGNVVKMRGTVNVGMVGDTAPVNVAFSGNTYYVDNLGGTNWAYMRSMTRAQWQAAGQDVAGTFLTW